MRDSGAEIRLRPKMLFYGAGTRDTGKGFQAAEAVQFVLCRIQRGPQNLNGFVTRFQRNREGMPVLSSVCE
jgi:hypothetical protein